MEQTGCVSELRKHKRIETRKTARLAVDDAWHDCVVLNVSDGGAKLVIDLAIEPGAAVVLADQDLGFVAGVVQRSEDDSVSLTFGISPDAQAPLIERLASYLNSSQQP